MFKESIDKEVGPILNRYIESLIKTTLYDILARPSNPHLGKGKIFLERSIEEIIKDLVTAQMDDFYRRINSLNSFYQVLMNKVVADNSNEPLLTNMQQGFDNIYSRINELEVEIDFLKSKDNERKAQPE
ncbi:MAG: hypothetical protein A3E87_01680 [Gammaproteobacteria bacterium RIFCSPHIGHO2_12_FULL_35_23]|nr:MAG: hypothetical protein A3E87_01680 [Gammaproteobacteria bacterium RIFCSPHIGHO2_12_FULL_35_23]